MRRTNVDKDDIEKRLESFKERLAEEFVLSESFEYLKPGQRVAFYHANDKTWLNGTLESYPHVVEARCINPQCNGYDYDVPESKFTEKSKTFCPYCESGTLCPVAYRVRIINEHDKLNGAKTLAYLTDETSGGVYLHKPKK